MSCQDQGTTIKVTRSSEKEYLLQRLDLKLVDLRTWMYQDQDRITQKTQLLNQQVLNQSDLIIQREEIL
jgi:hypothetical protein